MLIKPDTQAVEAIVHVALLEDAPWGDITSQTYIPSGSVFRAQLIAREAGILCGEDLFTRSNDAHPIPRSQLRFMYTMVTLLYDLACWPQ